MHDSALTLQPTQAKTLSPITAASLSSLTSLFLLLQGQQAGGKDTRQAKYLITTPPTVAASFTSEETWSRSGLWRPFVPVCCVWTAGCHPTRERRSAWDSRLMTNDGQKHFPQLTSSLSTNFILFLSHTHTHTVSVLFCFPFPPSSELNTIRHIYTFKLLKCFCLFFFPNEIRSFK